MSMCRHGQPLRLRILNGFWRVATLGRTTRVWIDDETYAQLLEGAARADALMAEIAAVSAQTAAISAHRRRLEARAVALGVIDAAGAQGDPRILEIVESTAAHPPLTAGGDVDEPAMVERVQAALAESAVAELLASLPS